jgi:hypothetical protein
MMSLEKKKSYIIVNALFISWFFGGMVTMSS